MTTRDTTTRGLIGEFIRSQGSEDEFDACRHAVAKHLGDKLRPGAVDLLEVAHAKGLHVERRSDLPYEGMIERDQDGSARITLRRGLNRRRERFTLAHELGHWLLQQEMLGTVAGRLFRGVSRDTAELRDEERLANLLAAEILVPVDQLRMLFAQRSKLQALLSVCRVFGVSRTMAVRRIADVCDQAIVLLQIVPYLFKRLDTLAEIDDAIYATAREATLFDRQRSRLSERFSYSDLLDKEVMVLQVRSPKGLIAASFELNHRPQPIPHTFGLACLDKWPVQKGQNK